VLTRALAGVLVVGIGLAAPARADLDVNDFYSDLRSHGFLVDGNEAYMLNLAEQICSLRDAGYDQDAISDWIARHTGMPRIRPVGQPDAYQFYLDSLDICSQLHPRLVP
jgi:hypothetical protein